MSENLGDKAYASGFEYERDYGGCAQCAIAALYNVFPELRNEEVFRSATGLGAGVGLSTVGNCGALTAAVMILSQIHGRDLATIADPERKRFIAYRLGRKLVQRFLDEYGTVTCGRIQEKLMGRSFNLYEEWNEFLAAGGHSTACTSVVGNAARWAAELIDEVKKKGIDEVIKA